jgi:hypothetical protein
VARFLKTLGTLIVLLFLLASGIDATLDRLASSPHQNQMAIYGARNNELLVYTGDLNRFAEVGKVDPSQMPRFLRRAKNPGLVPALPDDGYRWL